MFSCSVDLSKMSRKFVNLCFMTQDVSLKKKKVYIYIYIPPVAGLRYPSSSSAQQLLLNARAPQLVPLVYTICQGCRLTPASFTHSHPFIPTHRGERQLTKSSLNPVGKVMTYLLQPQCYAVRHENKCTRG